MCRGDGVAAAPQHAIDAAEAERRRREKQQKGTPTRTIVSFRKTRSIEKYFAGLNPPSRFASWYNILAETAVVCVRRICFRASFSSNGHRWPIDPEPPDTCMFFTRS